MSSLTGELAKVPLAVWVAFVFIVVWLVVLTVALVKIRRLSRELVRSANELDEDLTAAEDKLRSATATIAGMTRQIADLKVTTAPMRRPPVRPPVPPPSPRYR